MSNAKATLEMADKYPYDASDEWLESSNDPAPVAMDWAQRAARGVIADLQDRRGIKHEFSEVDEDVRAEIVASLSDIIRQAYRDSL